MVLVESSTICCCLEGVACLEVCCLERKLVSSPSRFEIAVSISGDFSFLTTIDIFRRQALDGEEFFEAAMLSVLVLKILKLESKSLLSAE